MAEIRHVLFLSEDGGTVRLGVKVTGDRGAGGALGQSEEWPARSGRGSSGAAEAQRCRAAWALG